MATVNIFASDKDPVKAARALDDKRLVKMVLETAQLTSTGLSKFGYWDYTLYKPTHQNHPCAVWCRETLGNWNWTVRHGLALADEYRYRFFGIHQSRQVIERCSELSKQHTFLMVKRQPFANCTGIDGPDTIQNYRDYLNTVKWSSGASWTRRGPPEWYNG